MACTEETEARSDIMVDCTSHFTAKQVFDNKHELLTWVRDIGMTNGFIIIIRTSNYGGGRKRPSIYLACERSGKYRLRKKLKDGSEDLLRQTSTKKCGYPFDLRAYKLKANNEWTLDVVCGLHNHPAAEYLQGHSYAGRLSANEKSLLVDNMSIMKTIYNVRHRCRVLQKAGRSQMQ
ncbi:uncharacterized protein LOC114261500 [Camellia sinensis]|uniref:uncharacterized protein LOC114261500 n=1 Tax=Camellia sinensis TaxID=4442 RepID=UPI001035B0F2|nr:uncharacterized protein LOC114261500 [Camellia sinensis]